VPGEPPDGRSGLVPAGRARDRATHAGFRLGIAHRRFSMR
jgi:hypothetical protein